MSVSSRETTHPRRPNSLSDDGPALGAPVILSAADRPRWRRAAPTVISESHSSATLESARVVDVGGADVALVHDYLNQWSGAERVVLELSRMWPKAPIYTSLYRPHSTFPEYRERDVRTTFLDRLPVDERFRSLAPLYPAGFRSLGTLDNELVISSS